MKNIDNSNPPRILVIEDEQSLTRVLRLCLQDAGFDVATTTSGREALEILKQDQPDAVILDLDLRNGLSGAVLDWLHKGGNKGPVWVAISAMNGNLTKKKYSCLNNRFLEKPFDPWDLVNLLKKLLIGKE